MHQEQDNNGDWHPCAYLSKLFSPTKCNYEIYNRELLGIIQAQTDWRHYLIGSPHKVTVLSDHQNLTYFKTAQKLNWQLLRYISPVLAFGTERRYLIKVFCYYLWIKPNLLLVIFLPLTCLLSLSNYSYSCYCLFVITTTCLSFDTSSIFFSNFFLIYYDVVLTSFHICFSYLI